MTPEVIPSDCVHVFGPVNFSGEYFFIYDKRFFVKKRRIPTKQEDDNFCSLNFIQSITATTVAHGLSFVQRPVSSVNILKLIMIVFIITYIIKKQVKT